MTALGRSLRYAESEVIAYRRTWRGTVITSFVNPVLFLAAMGAGLGSLVDEGTGGLTVSYLAFVASGLMAANAMQNGLRRSFQCTGIIWRASGSPRRWGPPTSSGPTHLGMGNDLVLLVFAMSPCCSGLWSRTDCAIAGVLTGVAFTTCITAWTLTQRDGRSLSTLFRFMIVPLFLFSGTFFPISQLPDWIEPVAYLTPLFHGVELVRKISLPGADASIVTDLPLWVHLTYLIVMATVGLWLSVRLLDRRIRQ
jgi:lipooligosaccharide transport system permease protein